MKKQIKRIGFSLLSALTLFCLSGCFGKMKFYTNEKALSKDMLAMMKNQYGIDFEIGTWRDGTNDFYYIKGLEYEFTGIVQPENISDSDKKSTYTIITRFIIAVEILRHTRMFTCSKNSSVRM